MTSPPSSSPRTPSLGAIEGAILGTAVGDSIGLPREGLSPRRARRLFGDDLEQRFLLGKGFVSDDTEHTCLVAQALLRSPTDEVGFGRSLGWRLRGWLLALPAGIGFGTLRALIKLWLGFPPHMSGVFTAGNGPAMRAPILGACLGDTELLRRVVRVSTRITHTDPKAEEGALAAALAAHHGAMLGASLNPSAFLDTLRSELSGEELRAALGEIGEHLARGSSPAEFAAAIGQEKGISGYVNHTMPAVLFCWLRSPGDFERALSDLIRLGGDADTTGAILGGISGAAVGSEGIPSDWVEAIGEWPRSVPWLRRLAGRLHETYAGDARPGPLPLFWPAIPLRNLMFLSVVLGHGFRRLLPPY